MKICPGKIYRIDPKDKSDPYWLRLSDRTGRVQLATDAWLDETPLLLCHKPIGRINEPTNYIGAELANTIIEVGFGLSDIREMLWMKHMDFEEAMIEKPFDINDPLLDTKRNVKR